MKIRVKCSHCGNEFYRIQSHFKKVKHHFCNHKCYGKWKMGCIPWNKDSKGIMKPNSGSFKKGQHFSPETEFKKGESGYWLGKKHSKETIEKIRKKRRGKPLPHLKKYQFKNGEHRNQKTEFKKNQIPWNKDKPVYQIRGEKHWNWKDDITTLYHKIRTSLKFKQWRRAVFELDDYTCQDCDKGEGIYLHAHHIKTFAVIIKENDIKTFEDALKCKEMWNIANGITLCKKCHRVIHNN